MFLISYAEALSLPWFSAAGVSCPSFQDKTNGNFFMRCLRIALSLNSVVSAYLVFSELSSRKNGNSAVQQI